MGNPLVYRQRAPHPEGFNPFDPDLAGTLREVRAWLDTAPRPLVLMPDSAVIERSSAEEIGALIDRALRRIGA